MFGRDAELVQIERVLDRVAVGPSGLALEGAPGIGKTMLWREAVVSARRRDCTVISTVPGEPDRALAFAGLGDLFDGLGDPVVAGLPDPQRHALTGALSPGSESPSRLDPQALARAILTVLRRLADQAPLVIAIDDEQWLDPASAHALAFALCRLRDDRVAVLLARRSRSTGALWPELSRGFGREGLPSLVLEPLDLATIHNLLKDQLGRSISRPLLRRIHAASGGNPLYALAIARELGTRAAGGATERELPIPASLTDALSLRLASLDQRAGLTLLAVAAVSQPTVALLQAVIPDFSLADLDGAVRAGVIEMAGDRVLFTHPLLASTHYASAAAATRRELHRTLAEVVPDGEERAYHLARGAEAPDRAIASTIEHAATTAARRGAPHTAAALLEDAVRLTPIEAAEERWSRTIAAAEQHNAGGAAERSRDLLETILPEVPHGTTRARALGGLADVRTDDLEIAEALLEEALGDAGDDHRVRAQIESLLAGWLSNRGKFAAMERHARAAVASAERAVDPGEVALALAAQAGAAFMVGQKVDREALRRGIALENCAEATTYVLPSTALGQVLFWSDDFDAARPVLERVIRRADERGEEYDVGALVFHLAMLEWYAGNRDAAERHRATADRVVRDQGGHTLDGWLAWGEALFAAGRGELEPARTRATEAVAMAYGIGDVLIAALGEAVLGSLELWTGEPDAAHDRAQRVRESLLGGGFGFLGSLTLGLWSVDIEALIAGERFGEAQLVLDDLLARSHGSENPNPNAIAIAERCRGLILAARGDVLAAIDAMDAALAAHAQRSLAPELARTLLERGSLQRRAKRKRAARQSLEQALAIFEAMNAAMWTARARDELSRIGFRRATEIGGLTPAQRRVAELVASGMSNREVAGVLYMSQRSVESHLTKVYRELGVRSRAQLVASLAARTLDGQPPDRQAVARASDAR